MMLDWRNEQNLAQMFQGLRSDYDIARSSRYIRTRSGVSAVGSGVDYHIRRDTDYLKILELARDFDRNDPIIGQAVTRLVDNVVQSGFSLDVNTADDGINQELKARWDAWTETPRECSDSYEHTFHDLERLTYRAMLVDGDIIHLPLRKGTLETIEAHRVRTPGRTRRNVVGGFLLDNRRRRLECWITKEDIDPSRTILVNDTTAYPVWDKQGRRQVIHVYNPKRLSQTRGISAFAPIANFAGMHDDIQFAKLVQQQVVSCFAFIRMRKLGFDGVGSNAALGSATTESLSDGTTRTVQGIAPGMEITGQPGEDIQGFSPNIPNQEYFEHVSMILGIISVNLGLPLAVVLLDPTKTNFSGWRGAIDQARIGFAEQQRILLSRFHEPVFEWKVRQWIADDPKLARYFTANLGELRNHAFHTPTWRYIEPYKDAQADALRLESGLSSPRRVHAERGIDWDDLCVEIVDDHFKAIQYAKQRAIELNSGTDDGSPVTWRDLLPTGSKAPQPATPPAPDEEDEDEDENQRDKPPKEQPQ